MEPREARARVTIAALTDTPEGAACIGLSSFIQARQAITEGWPSGYDELTRNDYLAIQETNLARLRDGRWSPYPNAETCITMINVQIEQARRYSVT